jgi:hypothetical protein
MLVRATESYLSCYPWSIWRQVRTDLTLTQAAEENWLHRYGHWRRLSWTWRWFSYHMHGRNIVPLHLPTTNNTVFKCSSLQCRDETRLRWAQKNVRPWRWRQLEKAGGRKLGLSSACCRPAAVSQSCKKQNKKKYASGAPTPGTPPCWSFTEGLLLCASPLVRVGSVNQIFYRPRRWENVKRGLIWSDSSRSTVIRAFFLALGKSAASYPVRVFFKKF